MTRSANFGVKPNQVKFDAPSDLYGFQVSVNSSISLGVSKAPLSRLHERTEQEYDLHSDTYFTFFPESLDLSIAMDNPSGRPGGGCDSGFVFRILVTGDVSGGGMLVTVPAGSTEPPAAILLSLASSGSSASSLTLLVTAFLPFFADLGFAGVFFFSEDTMIGCSSEWRERYHLQMPLCTPRSPIKKLVEHSE